jgi:hypothetical protein
MGIETAILGGAVLSAGTQLFGASKSASAAKKAAAQLNAQKAENTSLLAPYTQAGTNALSTYQTALGLNGTDAQKGYFNTFQNDPGWKAASDYGANTVNERYRLGGSSGGNVQAALYDYGQKNMNDAYSTRLSQLSGLANTGLSATTSLMDTNSKLATEAATQTTNAGNAWAQGISGAGNAVAGGTNALGNYNLFSNAANNAATGQGASALANMFGSKPANDNLLSGSMGVNNARRYG